MDPPGSWIEIGTVGRAHGVRGELYLYPIYNDSTLIVDGLEVVAVAPGTQLKNGAQKLKISKSRLTPRGWLVDFCEVDGREAAAALTNSKLFVRREALPEPDEDEIYQSDLIGLTVIDDAGRTLGVVRGFFFNGAHDVLVLTVHRGDEETEVLLPFLDDSLVDVDVDRGQVVLEVPDGIPGLEFLRESSDGAD